MGSALVERLMGIEKIAVLGAGQMGNGIAQVTACAGYDVTMIDIKQEYVDKGLAAIENSLARVVKKERMTAEEAANALARVGIATDKSAAADADLVVEAIPEIPDHTTLRVTLGPQDDLFEETFLESEWRMTPQTNRLGMRLSGPELRFRPRDDYLATQAGSGLSNVVDDVSPIRSLFRVTA